VGQDPGKKRNAWSGLAKQKKSEYVEPALRLFHKNRKTSGDGTEKGRARKKRKLKRDKTQGPKRVW